MITLAGVLLSHCSSNSPWLSAAILRSQQQQPFGRSPWLPPLFPHSSTMRMVHFPLLLGPRIQTLMDLNGVLIAILIIMSILIVHTNIPARLLLFLLLDFTLAQIQLGTRTLAPPTT